MKLAFVFDACFTKYKDGYYSVNLTQELFKKRYLPFFDEVVVVGRVKKVSTEPTGKLVRSDSEEVHFKTIPNGSRLTRLLKLKKENDFIENAIRDCDAVICRGWWGIKACQKLKKPYMIESISCTWDALWNHSLAGKLFAVPAFLMQRNAIKNAPYVIYVTKEFLQRRYPPNGITAGISDVALTDEFSVTVLENRFSRIESKHKKLVLGTAAAIDVNYKGQRFVVKALAALKKRGFDKLEYHMVGSGNQAKLAELAKKLGVENQVKFLGSVPHDKIFDWFDSIDIYIQPSLQEGLPRSVAEAMSRALPCICFNTGGMPELIEPEFICNKGFGKVTRLANKIVEISDAAVQKRVSRRNFEKSKEYAGSVLDKQRAEFMQNFVNKL